MIVAETPGVSQCYDAQGQSVGKVVADKNGNTVVYNDKDVPIGTGSVRKVSERSYEVCYFFSKNVIYGMGLSSAWNPKKKGAFRGSLR